jgi:outer membrane protein assembly factor BamB
MSSVRRAVGLVGVCGFAGTLALWQAGAAAQPPQAAPPREHVLGRLAQLQGAAAQPPQVAPPPLVIGAKQAVIQKLPVAAPVPFPPGQVANPACNDALTLPTDRKAKRSIDVAQDLIKQEKWGEAAVVLQSLLDTKEDLFVEVERNGATHSVSLRGEANRLIGTLPPQGRQFYELQFGARAKARLAEAKAKSDPEILAEVALRYLNTQAGAEAINLLGTRHLDRGDSMGAARWYERLLEHENGGQVSPLVLLKATLAFRRAGESTRADQTWKRFTRAAGRDGLRFGERTVSPEELQKEIERFGGSHVPVSPYDWAMFKGNPSRSAQGTGSAPFLETKWTYPTVVEKQTEQWLDQALKLQDSRQQPILPAFFPIAATVRTDIGPLPLLVYRSYWGIHARNIAKDGKLEWDSPSSGGLDRIAGEPEKNLQVNPWLSLYLQSNPNLLYENSTIGTLSTDDKRAYIVDDLALPPHPSSQPMQQLMWGQPAMFGKLHDSVYHSRLMAFDLKSGKLIWELGGRGSDKGELADSFFLGPPLPVADKLYVLVDKNSELRLVCLEASADDRPQPSIAWVQSLANVRDKLLLDVGRRMQAAHLSYGDGILICPTNAGAVIAVDILSHSFVWAHSYREDTPQVREPIHRNVGRAPPGVMHALQNSNLGTDWKTSAPVIQDGRVVFTAPDAASIHCLNLRTGDLLWKERRADDLYLAGVFNGKVLLVGKSTCRALNLADGKQLWKVETGMPSGQGVASDNVYYLPLKIGAQSKEPEVCAIDIDKGIALAHTKSRKKEVPGNLLFYEGDVLSQTATAITAYRQLRIKLAEIDLALQKNPRDAVGLTERGELKLDKGDLSGAVEDLRTALANRPPADILPKTRAKLFETLTELFQQNFAASEKYLAEYRAMCTVDIPADATPLDRRKLEDEQSRRQANFLCLLAKGREKQGRLLEAYQAYAEFGALAGNHELVSVIDEPTIKARPDVWAQGRIAAMVAHAAPQQRKPLEEKIADQWAKVREGKDTQELRRFVDLFGSLFTAGKEARLQLAEKLIEENAFLEAELHLLQLRHQEDKQVAARAVEDLARLMIRKGLLEDAASWYRVLGREFAGTIVRDGKAGTDFLNDLATDKRLLPYLDEPRSPWAQVRLQAAEVTGNFTFQQAVALEPEGELLPFFRRHHLLLQNGATLKLVERGASAERWSQDLSRTSNINYLYNNGYNNVRFPYHVQGHLVVLNLGPMVYAFDPVDQKKLWEHNLNSSPLTNQNVTVTPTPDGGFQVNYPDGYCHVLGQPGPVEASYVCLNTRDGLVALDALRGTVLWTKSDVPVRAQVFGDDQHVYLVEVRADGSTGSGKALRARDGVSVDVPEFGPLYQRRLRILGRHLLLRETAAKGDVVLRLYDVHTGKDLWKNTFKSGAIVLRSEDPDLVAVVERSDNCKLTISSLSGRQEVFTTTMDRKDLDRVTDAYLLTDKERFYVAIHKTPDAGVNPWGGPFPNVVNGMRWIPVNGKVYAYDRDRAKPQKNDWKAEVVNQMLVLDQFREVPVLLFTAMQQRPVQIGGVNRGGIQQVAVIRSVDKRTGKLLLDKEYPNRGNQFGALRADAQTGRVELISYNLKIVHGPEGDAASPDAASKTEAPRKPRTGALAPVPAPLVPDKLPDKRK